MIVKHEGKILVVIAEPHIETQSSNVFLRDDVYVATAVDEEYEYRVVWEIINEETDDESEACDWDNPIDITRLGKRYKA